MPRPKLIDRLRFAIRAKHYSPKTEQAYVHWTRRYVRFHAFRHPREMGAEEINAFLTHLAVDRHVSASTQNQAASALLFLYRRVLHIDVHLTGEIVRARRTQSLPIVLTRQEISALLSGLKGDPRLVALLLYGAGLRLSEAMQLRVKDLDCRRREVSIRSPKNQARSGDRAAGRRSQGAPGKAGAEQGSVESRSTERRRLGGTAPSLWRQGARRRPRLAVAMGIPRDADLPSPGLGSEATPPSPPNGRSTSGHPSRTRDRPGQTSHVP